MPEGPTAGPTSKEELAAELRRLLLAAQRRSGGSGRRKRSALARSVGVSASSLYAYLNGTTLPPTEVLDRLLDALNVAAAERQRLATARDAIEIGRSSRRHRSRADDDHTPPPAGVLPVPRQLPAAPQMFTGRAPEVAVLDQLHDAPTVVITAIQGMAGVGKTALAVQAGHRLADRYPDGQIFIDLHGFTESLAPVEPSDALDRLLRSLGVPGERIPADLGDRAGLWRSVLAARRMMIILDNAASEAQVAPLLPGAPGCLVLVTSRRRLTGLDATRVVSLDALPPADAWALFVSTAGSDRLANQPTGQIAEAIDLCGRLPLALRIAAARLRSRSSWGVAELVERLRDKDQLWVELADGTRGVAAALELSIRQLTPALGRMYRALGLHPGADLDSYAAAALTGTTATTATGYLDQLHDAHLLQEPEPGRFTCHDLIRAHARRTVVTGESERLRRAALTRLFDYYRRTASVAMDVAHPYERERRPRFPSTTATPDLTDPVHAIGWLDIELPNLLAVAQHAADNGWPQHACDLATILHRHLLVRGQYHTAGRLHHEALACSRDNGSQAAELEALVGLGDVHRTQGHYAEAKRYYAQARTLAGAAGHGAGELEALIGLGKVSRRQGHVTQAARHFQRARTLAGAAGHRVGELEALIGLGNIERRQGRYPRAATHYHRALRLARDTGYWMGEHATLTGLANLYWLQGRYARAADHFEQAGQIARANGNQGGEMTSLIGLSSVDWLRGRHDKAIHVAERALEIARTIGHQAGELDALTSLGQAYRLQRQYTRAAEHLEEALRIARAMGRRPGELAALSGLCQVYRVQGLFARAAEHGERLLELAQDTGDRNYEFEARQGMGRLAHATGEPEAALAHHRQALAIATDLQQPADQVRAHDGLAHAFSALAQRAQARRHWQNALDILTDLDTDHTEDEEANISTIRTHLAPH